MNYVGDHARARATYIYGIRPAVPAVPLTDDEVAAWRAKWGATCSDRCARTLATLERDYSITGAAPGRSAGPTA